MLGRFAFAVFVTTLFALSRFTTVVQAQAHLQPRDTLPTRSNSTQGDILPRNDLASLSFGNTSGTYSRSGAKSMRSLVARNPPHAKIPLEKIPFRPHYTAKISVELKNEWKDFDVVFATTAFDYMWLVSKNFPDGSSKFHFEHKFDHAGRRVKKFEVRVFGGEGQGDLYQARTKIGPVDLGVIYVGALKQIRGFSGEVGDGILPLGRLAQNTNSRSSAAWQRLVGPTDAHPHLVVAFALRSNGGEFHIGVDDMAYDSIVYYKCDQSSPFWTIKGVSIQVGLQLEEGQTIIFDTTSQFIRGPKSMVQKFYDGIITLKGFSIELDTELGLYTIPCSVPQDKLPEIISIGLIPGHGPRWTIGRQLFIQRMATHPGQCFGLFAAHTENTASISKEPNRLPTFADWVIGHPAMEDNYIVFDWVKASIGIAKLKPEYRFVARRR